MKMKRILAIILSVLMLMSVVPLTASAETEYTSGDYKYTVTNKQATITEYTGAGNIEGNEIDLVIPSKLGGYPVVSIAQAFHWPFGLRSITIPNTVTTIQDNAFHDCRYVKTLVIPDSVVSIGFQAFAGMTSLTNLTLSNALQTIEDRAFAYCGVSSITIPPSVTYIGRDAFRECEWLSSVTFGGEQTEISLGNWAFEDCARLKSLTINGNVAETGSSVFSGCNIIRTLTLGKGVTDLANTYVGMSTLQNIYVNSENTMFADMSGVLVNKKQTELIKYPSGRTQTEYTIPDSITSIRAGAFYNHNLKKITIGSGVASLGEKAFDCRALEEFFVPEKNKYFSNDAFGVLYNKDKTELVRYPQGNSRTEYAVADSAISVAEYAFYYVDALESVTFADCLETISDNAFYDCSNLKNAVLPVSLQTIGKEAFDTTKIGTVNIPEKVSFIGEDAFDYCTELAFISVDEENEYYSSDESGVLFDKNKTTLIKFPMASAVTEYVLPDTVLTINEKAFYDCVKITSVMFPEGLQTIGVYAFGWCENLKSVTIPDSVTEMESAAFTVCSSLERVKLGNGLTTINSSAFSSSKIRSICIPDGVKEIGDYAFSGCSELENIVLPDTLKDIGYYAFRSVKPKHVAYKGTEEQWSNIRITYTTNADSYFSSAEYIHLNFDYDTDVTEVSVPSTCLQEGSMTLNCSCGYSFSYNTGYADHDYVQEIITPATHLTEGSAVYTCSDCGDTYTAPVAKLEGHTYDAATTAPTCTEQGYTTYTCECGDSYVADFTDANGHDYKSEITTPATHLTEGVETFTCSTCGDTYTEAVAKLDGHTYTAVVTAPTCIDQGYTTYTCECGDTYVADYVDALGHAYTSAITTPATHLTEGVETFTCSTCGDTYTEAVAKLDGHIYAAAVTAPTCTDQGYTTYTCECGDTYVADYADALGHAYTSAITTPATHLTEGVETFTCTTCGDTYTKSVAKLDGHTYTAAVTAPTCTEQGYTTYTCVCGDSYKDDYAAATGHAYVGTVTTQPTCTADGVKTFVCSNDADHAYTEPVDKLGHTAGTAVMEDKTEATCTVDGSYNMVVYCATCGEKLSSIAYAITALGHTPGAAATCTEDQTCTVCGCLVTAKLGHAYVGTVTTNPTCTETGVKTYVCSNDASHTYTEAVAATGHSYNTVVTAPTCTEKGYTTYTCATCGDTYVADYKNATGHSHKATVTTAATHMTTGIRTYTCKCGDTYTEVIDKLTAHNHKAVVTTPATHLTTGVKTYTCECGDTYTTAIPKTTAHTYTAEVLEEAQCKKAGKMLYACECGDSYTEKIPELGHIDVDDDSSCDRCGIKVCSCMCHQSGFMGFIWKIVKIFWKLFGMNPVCECGRAHY